jgi:hypothetical protein
MNPRIAKLPTYKGIPIVFFASIDKNGVPDFKITDEDKRRRCATECLCWICGDSLTQPICFIGGPRGCEAGLFTDGPMHENCAYDAMEMCPWLCGRMDYAQHFNLDRHAKPVTLATTGRTHQAPDKVGIYFCYGFDVVDIPPMPQRGFLGCWLFKAYRPTRLIWRDRKPRQQPGQHV